MYVGSGLQTDATTLNNVRITSNNDGSRWSTMLRPFARSLSLTSSFFFQQTIHHISVHANSYE